MTPLGSSKTRRLTFKGPTLYSICTIFPERTFKMALSLCSSCTVGPEMLEIYALTQKVSSGYTLPKLEKEGRSKKKAGSGGPCEVMSQQSLVT